MGYLGESEEEGGAVDGEECGDGVDIGAGVNKRGVHVEHIVRNHHRAYEQRDCTTPVCLPG